MSKFNFLRCFKRHKKDTDKALDLKALKKNNEKYYVDGLHVYYDRNLLKNKTCKQDITTNEE